MPAVPAAARISQVQLIFCPRLAAPDFAPGSGSRETKQFAWEESPWGALAFPRGHRVLEHHRDSAAPNGVALFENSD